MDREQKEYYGVYGPVIEQTAGWALVELRELLSEIARQVNSNPDEHICSRIKTVSSVKTKLEQRHYSTDAKSALEHLSDVIGIRIVTHFVGDVYTVLQKIRDDMRWQVLEVKDYISNPKDNGYRSLHVILDIPVHTENLQGAATDLTSIRVEVQLRTIAMDCWASLEHEMKYKKNVRHAELITDELKRCADEIASTDLTMQTLRDQIRSEE